MENNKSNALAEIQQKYAGCNLLMPTSTEVQLSPFYKITVMEVNVDTSDKSGDIFKVGSTKVGDRYEDVFSPAKPLLMKLAAAAGIQFDPDHTYGTRVDQNTFKAKAFGAMRMPDGTGKTHADEKTIRLDDEEANMRLEFMDKSIKGITDEKAAKAAAELFKGTWIDSTNKWGKPCKAFLVDDADREKYIERSVLVNMTLLRKFAAEKAMTGAINRVIRALTGLKGQYTKAELIKPFAIPRVTFSPDYTDPEVKSLMLAQGMNSIGTLFGTTPITAPPAMALPTHNDIFDAEDLLAENAAFASDTVANDIPYPVQTPEEEPVPQPTPQPEPQQTPQPVPQAAPPAENTGYTCSECGTGISEKVYEYSIDKFGRPLCIKCQKGAH